jgi:predicted GNAT family N-acyltransferase
MLNDLVFKPLDISYLDRVDLLESSSYPEDEKASRTNLKLRLENAPNVFLGVFKKGQNDDETYSHDNLIGYACSTQADADTLTHDSMSKHTPNGRLLCLHSVVIDPKERRHGYGKQLLNAYIQHVRQTEPNIQKIMLLSKEYLTPFYQNSGFTLIGPSSVQHGQETWFDMFLELYRHC